MGLRTAGVGFALALSASPLLAQGQPAATLGQIRPVGDPIATTARGQVPDPRMAPLPSPLFKTQIAPVAVTKQMQPGVVDPLQPKPIPNPMVMEQRDQNGQPIPLAVSPGGMVPPALTPCAPMAVYPAAPGVAPLGLEDPYWGGAAGSYALFPRLRNAVVGGPMTGRFSVGAEYLLWFAKAQGAPTLFTTSSPQFNGILGQGDTRSIFGEQSLGGAFQSGGRFSASYLFANQNWGIDGNVWFLGNSTGSYFRGSDSDPLIARPFTSANTGQEFSQLTAYPGLATGSARIDFDTNVWGAEVNLKRALACTPCSRLDFLIGYKNLNLSESLIITENFQRTPNSPTNIGAPTAIAGVVQDRFRTENHFDGVNLGLRGELRRGRWYLDGKASVALGQVYQQVSIEGSQTILHDNGAVTRSNGGLLALPGANIGQYTQSKFGALPEAGLTLGVYLTPHLKIGVGYNMMYLNSVVRPAGQIDNTIDVTRIPNFPLNPSPAQNPMVRPTALPLRETDFFVQGLTFQLQWTW